MRRISIAAIVALFLASSLMPVFAEETAKKSDNLFVIIADSLKPGPGKEKNKLRKIEKIDLFQSLADGIKEGSQKARGESLRAQK